MRPRISTSSRRWEAIGRQVLGRIALIIGLAALMLGNPLAFADEADEADEAEQAAAQESGSDQLSERQRRREERRQAREAEERSAVTAQEADENVEEESQFVVYVEPELECRNVAVTGSRMPKRVCTPVGQAAQDEENAQEFLRRTRELSTIVPPEDTSASDPFRF